MRCWQCRQTVEMVVVVLVVCGVEVCSRAASITLNKPQLNFHSPIPRTSEFQSDNGKLCRSSPSSETVLSCIVIFECGEGSVLNSCTKTN